MKAKFWLSDEGRSKLHDYEIRTVCHNECSDCPLYGIFCECDLRHEHIHRIAKYILENEVTNEP